MEYCKNKHYKWMLTKTSIKNLYHKSLGQFLMREVISIILKCDPMYSNQDFSSPESHTNRSCLLILGLLYVVVQVQWIWNYFVYVAELSKWVNDVVITSQSSHCGNKKGKIVKYTVEKTGKISTKRSKFRWPMWVWAQLCGRTVRSAPAGDAQTEAGPKAYPTNSGGEEFYKILGLHSKDQSRDNNNLKK